MCGWNTGYENDDSRGDDENTWRADVFETEDIASRIGVIKGGPNRSSSSTLGVGSSISSSESAPARDWRAR